MTRKRSKMEPTFHQCPGCGGEVCVLVSRRGEREGSRGCASCQAKGRREAQARLQKKPLSANHLDALATIAELCAANGGATRLQDLRGVAEALRRRGLVAVAGPPSRWSMTATGLAEVERLLEARAAASAEVRAVMVAELDAAEAAHAQRLAAAGAAFEAAGVPAHIVRQHMGDDTAALRVADDGDADLRALEAETLALEQRLADLVGVEDDGDGLEVLRRAVATLQRRCPDEWRFAALGAHDAADCDELHELEQRLADLVGVDDDDDGLTILSRAAEVLDRYAALEARYQELASAVGCGARPAHETAVGIARQVVTTMDDHVHHLETLQELLAHDDVAGAKVLIHDILAPAAAGPSRTSSATAEGGDHAAPAAREGGLHGC